MLAMGNYFRTEVVLESRSACAVPGIPGKPARRLSHDATRPDAALRLHAVQRRAARLVFRAHDLTCSKAPLVFPSRGSGAPRQRPQPHDRLQFWLRVSSDVLGDREWSRPGRRGAVCNT